MTRRKNTFAWVGWLGFVVSLNACSQWEQLWDRDLGRSRNQSRSENAPDAHAEDPSSQKPRAPDVNTSGWSREKLFAYFNELRGDGYPLDELPRRLDTPDSEVPCLPEEQQIYRGTHVKFVPITVHPAFVQRLEQLELLFVEEAESFYGRPPRTILHEGGYACRTSRFRSRRISEHAFGNAIDITGFSFGPLPPEKADTLGEAVPRGAFQVRVLTHWTSRGGALADLHQSFLRFLGERIVDEKVIRVALGPSHRGHQSHLHLDMSPWRYVNL